MTAHDLILAQSDDWALASDGVQWILQRRRTRRGVECWNPVSFVRSTRNILARCMREKGVGAGAARFLLSGLPDSFDQWKASQHAPQRQGLATLVAAELFCGRIAADTPFAS